MAKKVVIASACRTAIGTMGGSLSTTPAAELGAIVIKEAINRAGIEPAQVDQVYMGCVIQAGLGQNVARQASIKAGLPIEVPAVTMNVVCGSGLNCVNQAAQMIMAGDADVVVAGGMENMSMAPYAAMQARFGYRMNNGKFVDTMVNDALWDAFNDYHMIKTADNIAEQWGLTREELDEFALNSQQKASKAIETGAFKDEIVPVEVKKKKETIVFDTDEGPRPNSTMEGLAKLKTSFKDGGTVTAGNASGMNDASSGVILMSEEKAKETGAKTLARVAGVFVSGVDPDYMGIGPLFAIPEACKRAGIEVKDLDLVELNEAFAAQAYACIKELGLSRDIVNVHGSGISLGHPVGATGTRMITTLIYEAQKRNAAKAGSVKWGVASACAGTGMGVAVVFEF